MDRLNVCSRSLFSVKPRSKIAQIKREMTCKIVWKLQHFPCRKMTFSPLSIPPNCVVSFIYPCTRKEANGSGSAPFPVAFGKKFGSLSNLKCEIYLRPFWQQSEGLRRRNTNQPEEPSLEEVSKEISHHSSSGKPQTLFLKAPLVWRQCKRNVINCLRKA